MDDRTTLMSPRPLSAGHQITWYEIREVLGMGGFGITYRAYDQNLDRDVAIKEYLPTSFAHRHVNFSVKAITGDHEQHYKWGLDNFLKEAKTLAKFNHDNIVKVHTVFEQNNTAYMVMEYEQGDSLASIIKQRGTLDQQFQTQIFFPILDGLQKIHEFGFVHRDIKPSNIYIRANGSPVLLDFGSARQTSLQETSEFTALISQGYTPLEQYSADYGEQGPWTDIYSLAATMYQGITGSKPDEALSRSACMLRSQPDRVQELLSADYPSYQQQFLKAVHTGLTLQPEYRPQSLAQWGAEFQGESVAHQHQATDTLNAPLDDKTRLTPRRPDTSDNTGTANLSESTRQPLVEPLTAAMMESDSDLDSSPGFDDDDFNIQNSGIRPPVNETQKQGGKGLAIGSALALIIAVAGGYFFWKNNASNPPVDTSTNTNTNTNTNSVAAKDIAVPTPTATKIEASTTSTSAVANSSTETTASTNAQSAAVEPIAPAITAQVETEATAEIKPEIATETKSDITTAVGPTLTLLFDQPISADITVGSPRTIPEIAASSPLFSPIEGMGEEIWKDKDCSNCHDWTRENLCLQGTFYTTGDSDKINRISHPMGGFFKKALQSWANNGCK